MKNLKYPNLTLAELFMFSFEHASLTDFHFCAKYGFHKPTLGDWLEYQNNKKEILVK